MGTWECGSGIKGQGHKECHGNTMKNHGSHLENKLTTLAMNEDLKRHYKAWMNVHLILRKFQRLSVDNRVIF